MRHQYRFMSGLPRSGSTVLSAVLYQNPTIHTEALSSLGHLMVQAAYALEIQQTFAAGREDHAVWLVSQLPDLYYSKIERPVIVDRNRAWVGGPMHDILMKYFETPKILVTTRDYEEVEQSFVKLCAKNNVDFHESPYYVGYVEARKAVEYIKKSPHTERFLFVDYEQLVKNPQKCLGQIYDFWELPKFDHNLNHIEKPWIEKDEVYGLIGMHDIKPFM